MKDELSIKIGDHFENDTFGEFKVLEIYISMSTQHRVFKIEDYDGSHFLVAPEEILGDEIR